MRIRKFIRRMLWAAALGLPAAASGASLEVLEASPGKLSLIADEVPLVDVLKRISVVAGFRLKTTGNLSRPISVKLRDIALDRMLRELAREDILVTLRREPHAGAPITEVRVYAGRAGPPPATASTMPSPEAHRASEERSAPGADVKIGQLGRQLTQNEDPDIRLNALRDMMKLRSAQTADQIEEYLEQALGDPDEGVRSAVLEAYLKLR